MVTFYIFRYYDFVALIKWLSYCKDIFKHYYIFFL